MPKVTGDHSASQWQSQATNALGAVHGSQASGTSQAVVTTLGKNADNSKVKDPDK